MMPGITELIIILVIVLILFGTKRLKGMGSDLGGMIKGFKKSVKDDDKDDNKKIGEQETVVKSTVVKETEINKEK